MKPAKLQNLYRWIVRMHPLTFRAQFGDEMLWIYREQSRSGSALRLLGDGVISLMRQWTLRGTEPQWAAISFGVIEDGPGMAPRRFVEAAAGVSLLLAGVMVLLGQLGRPYPVAPCLPGPPPRMHATSIAAPGAAAVSAVAVAPGAARRIALQTGAVEVDAAVSSAVRITRAGEGRGFAAAPYCVEMPRVK